MYEGYTHMANLFLSKICSRDGESCSQESGTVKTADSTINLELQEKIWQILDEDSEIDGGVTRLTTGDLALRIFGHRAQKLATGSGKIKKYTKMNGHKKWRGFPSLCYVAWSEVNSNKYYEICKQNNSCYFE